MKANEKVRKEILESVNGLTDKQLNNQVEQGRWTIAQVLQHLHLMESMIVKSIQTVLAKDENRPADEKPIHLAIDRSRKVEAPDALNPSDVEATLEEVQGELENSRHALRKLASDADEEKLMQKSFPHPVFGLMNLKQWIEFIGFHEKRHLAQIEELKKKLT